MVYAFIHGDRIIYDQQHQYRQQPNVYECTIPVRGRDMILKIYHNPDANNVSVDVAIFCYDCSSITSFESLKDHWIPKVLEGSEKVISYLIVATKSDRFDEIDPEGVSIQDAKSLQNKVRALALLECAAEKNEGVREVFSTAIKIGLNLDNFKRQGRLICCNLL